MTVYTASHFHPKHHKAAVFSISRTQPFNLPELKPLFPPAELLHDYKHNKIDWQQYQPIYLKHLQDNQEEIIRIIKSLNNDITLCCWEKSPIQCHRSLAAKFIQSILNCDVVIK